VEERYKDILMLTNVLFLSSYDPPFSSVHCVPASRTASMSIYIQMHPQDLCGPSRGVEEFST
jgi:hypothetical protein